jgi:hypothetical protein
VLVKFLGQRYSEKNSKFNKNRLTMLFWHLLGHENAHIRPSMLRFSFGRSLKIAIVIQFLVLKLNGVWTLKMM